MKESSIESRTRDERQAEKEAVAENTAAASFFVPRVPREQLVAVLERADNSIRCDHNPVDNAPGRASVYFLLTDPAMRVPVWDLERRNYAKREVSSIDAPSKPKVDVQESIANAKAYCKQNPESFVSLRDYSGGIYNETCAAFAAEQHAADPTYKIGSD